MQATQHPHDQVVLAAHAEAPISWRLSRPDERVGAQTKPEPIWDDGGLIPAILEGLSLLLILFSISFLVLFL